MSDAPDPAAPDRPFFPRCTWRGYDPRDVDDYLAAVQRELEQVRAEVREIRVDRDAVQRAATGCATR